jgi:hypothetical protein
MAIPSRLFAAGVAASMAASCGSPEPCYGLVPGTKMAVTIVEPYDTNSHFTATDNLAGPPGCGFGFDVAQGDVLHATVQSNAQGQGCDPAMASIAPFGNWTWTLTGPASSPETDGLGMPLQGDYSAVTPGCNGGLVLALTLVWGNLFDPSVRGQPPHVVMTRVFNPDLQSQNGPTCHACAAAFVVDLAHE